LTTKEGGLVSRHDRAKAQGPAEQLAVSAVSDLPAEGQSVPVPARDFAAISPSGRTLVILGENESETVVDVMLIERVEMKATA
jgi:hypothetical protein